MNRFLELKARKEALEWCLEAFGEYELETMAGKVKVKDSSFMKNNLESLNKVLN